MSFSPESILYTTPGPGSIHPVNTVTSYQSQSSYAPASDSVLAAGAQAVLSWEEGGSLSLSAGDANVVSDADAINNTSLPLPPSSTTAPPSSVGATDSGSCCASTSEYLEKGIVDDTLGFQEGYWRNKYNVGTISALTAVVAGSR